MLPLVSAIMPTRARQEWAAEAVKMFQAQTYPHKELVIIDDQMEPSFPMGISKPNVVYTAAARASIGGKRNLAISRAAGEVIMHWDDDDIYSPERMERQVKHLIESGADIVGFNSMLFVNVVSGERWKYNGAPGYCIGVSQTYWRETWEARQFPNMNQGEDNVFEFSRNSATIAATDEITVRIHPGNTCAKNPTEDPSTWERIA